ncbi:MAG TPA: hydroxymethylbilane synthase [Candidatus Hydrogenedentes bacterium]|jgi:hydroxymethylbilane synthase|nr:hydroxymethylbilane synthase [Candidatus Hydrogenedentota bacterium]
MPERIVIGSRGSELALCQSELIASGLRALEPGTRVDIQVIRTSGDKITDVPLAQIGGKGLFTKEIEEALLAGDIDLAVHSMKDLPTELPEGLCIGAVPKRESPCDVLVSAGNLTLEQLPPGARVGTSSLRRTAQLRAYRSDLEILPLRGNVTTRLRKVSEGSVDAAILAAAGLSRLGLSDRVSQEIPVTLMLPAPAQGALAIEARVDDTKILRLLAPLDDPETRSAVAAERIFLAAMEGGCQVPLGALASRSGEQLVLDACVCSLDGARVLRCRTAGRHDRPEEAGNQAAVELRNLGASALLESLR